MIKLLEILSEIKIMGSIDLLNNLNFIPPEKNESFIQWMNKNNMLNRYIDNVKGGYSIKIENQINIFFNDRNLLHQVPKNQILDIFEKNLDKLKNRLQLYFNQYFGENRIIVKKLGINKEYIQPQLNYGHYYERLPFIYGNYIRFLTKERPKLLKPENDQIT